VEPGTGAPFTVTLDVPVRRCPDCAVDNLTPTVARAARSAALAALARG